MISRRPRGEPRLRVFRLYAGRPAPPDHDGGATASALAGGRPATNGGSGGILDFVTKVVDTDDDLFHSQAVRDTPDENASAARGYWPGSGGYWSNLRDIMMNMVELTVVAGQRASRRCSVLYKNYEQSFVVRWDKFGIGSIA
jgi:hypothetical protein